MQPLLYSTALHASRCMHHSAAWGQSTPSFPRIRPTIMLQQRLLAMQDELYCQHLTDACHDAVRQLLGPRKALLWSRQVKGCLLQMGACFMLLFPPLFTEQGIGLQEPCGQHCRLAAAAHALQKRCHLLGDTEGECLSRSATCGAGGVAAGSKVWCTSRCAVPALCRETRLVAELLFHGVSTGAGVQTLGEEYCDILQVAGEPSPAAPVVAAHPRPQLRREQPDSWWGIIFMLSVCLGHPFTSHGLSLRHPARSRSPVGAGSMQS